MNFINTVETMIAASQALVWVRTHEATEARIELQQRFSTLNAEDDGKTKVYRWDVLQGLTTDQGVQLRSQTSDGIGEGVPFVGPEGLVESVAYMLKLINAPGPKEGDTKNKAVPMDISYILIVDNFHYLADMLPVIQALQDFSAGTRMRSSSIVLISHYDKRIGPDLKSYCSIVEHDLPSPAELLQLTNSILSMDTGTVGDLCDQLDEPKRVAIARAGMGLSRMQFQAELSFALVRISSMRKSGQDVTPDSMTSFLVEEVQDRKAALFNAEGLIQLYRSTESVNEIGGMLGLKKRLKQRFDRQSKRARTDKYPKGIILLGPPGTAKSTMARCVSNMLGVLMAAVDIGSVKEGIVGATEGRIRRVFQILNAMGRIVVFVDEIEKAFPTGDERDSGVSADILQVWLTNLSDPNRQYYMVASANSCSKLPPPLLRNGRFDNVYMCDIPKPAQRDLIWDICRKRYQIEDQTIPPCEGWTGAEIEACCDEADGMGVSLVEAAKVIIPTTVKNPNAVKAVQEYAHNLAIDAETGSIYYKPGSPEATAQDNAASIKPGNTVANRRRLSVNN